MQLNIGYSAGEWCSGHNTRENHAWAKYGGGKLLSDQDINDLLDLVVKWQKLVQVVLKDVLLDAVPGLNPDAIPYLHKSSAERGDPMHILGDAIQHVQDWSDTMVRRVGPDGCTVLPGEEKVDILIGNVHSGRHVFSIPTSLWNQMDSLNREMTGESFLSYVPFMMLNTGIWWESVKNPRTGSALGFTFRGMDLEMRISEEEGIRRAERMSRDALAGLVDLG